MSVDESTSSIVYAMLDSGSDRDIVTPELAKKLGLVQRAKSVTIQTVDSNMTSNRHFADLRVESIDEVYGADISGALVCSLLTSNEDAPPSKRGFNKLSHAQGIHFEDHDASVQMILGVAHAETWVGGEIRRGTRRQPSFVKTLFG